MNGGPRYCETCRKVAKQRGEVLDCRNCPDRCPDALPGNVKALDFYFRVANCVHYVSTMERPFISGLNWQDIKAFSEMYGERLTRPMLMKLRTIESLLIKESVGNGSNGNKG